MPSSLLRPPACLDARGAACTAAAVAVAGVALAGCSSAPTAAMRASARPACAAAVDAELRDVMRRVYQQAAAGRNVTASVARLARSRALGAAVARGDAPATRAALRPLLRAQIKRIVVTHGGRLLADVGRRRAALAPVRGTIRNASGAPAGRYTLSVATDSGIAELIRALTGANVVMRAGGREVASTRPGAAGTAPATASLEGTAFPSGRLRVSLLGPPVDPTLCGATPAATAADTIGAVAARLFRTESASARTARVLRLVATDSRFAAAVAAGDPVALRARIIHFFRIPTLHVVRIRATTAGGRLVGDVGGPYVLAPASTTARAGGRAVGTVTLSIQDDAGYVKLLHRLTGADVILRTPRGEVPGSTVSPGPARLPARGSVTYRGRTYRVVSLGVTSFPSGPLRVWVLVRRAPAHERPRPRPRTADGSNH